MRSGTRCLLWGLVAAVFVAALGGGPGVAEAWAQDPPVSVADSDASSHYWNDVPARAHDGNSTTDWEGARGFDLYAPWWLWLDLGEEYELSELQLKWNSLHQPKNYEIFLDNNASKDYQTWTNSFATRDDHSSPSLVVVPVSDQSGRYLRLLIWEDEYSNPDLQRPQLYEIWLFGTPSGGSTPPDTTAPSAPTITSWDTPVTSSSDLQGQYFDDTDLVHVYWKLGTNPASSHTIDVPDGSGTWNYTLSGLSAGTYDVWATAWDSSGNVSQESPQKTVVFQAAENLPPQINSLTPATGNKYDMDTSISITVDATDESVGSLQYQFKANGAVIQVWGASATAPWTPGSEDAGFNVIEAMVKDNIGQTNTAENTLYVLREPLPAPEPAEPPPPQQPGPPAITSAPDTTTGSTVISGNYTGTVTEIRIYVNSSYHASVNSPSGGTWSYTLSKPNGTYQVHATAKNSVGVESGESNHVTVTFEEQLPPPDPEPSIQSFALSDADTGNQTTTDERTVNVSLSVQDEAYADKWLINESSATPSAGSITQSSKPVSYEIQGNEGSVTLYAWILSTNGTVSGTSDAIILDLPDPPPPSGEPVWIDLPDSAVSASSVYAANTPPQDTIDEQTTSAVSYWCTANNGYGWIQYDLGSTRNLSHMRVWWHTSTGWGSSDHAIYVSDDPQNWGNAVRKGLDSEDLEPFPAIMDLSNKSGRYVTIEVQPETGAGPRLREVEIYEIQ